MLFRALAIVRLKCAFRHFLIVNLSNEIPASEAHLYCSIQLRRSISSIANKLIGETVLRNATSLVCNSLD
jgi:hypothetical protein